MGHIPMLNKILDSRMRASESSLSSIKERLAAAGKSSLAEICVKELFEIFPLPIDNDIIQIYNEETYNDLINSLSTEYHSYCEWWISFGWWWINKEI